VTDKLSGSGLMFKGLVSLTHLDIREFPSLRVIECGAFKHLFDTLVDLSLFANRIDTIEPGTFKCLSKLKKLRLSENQLASDRLAQLNASEELPQAVHLDF
jgi:hypothetical protein